MDSELAVGITHMQGLEVGVLYLQAAVETYKETENVAALGGGTGTMPLFRNRWTSIPVCALF